MSKARVLSHLLDTLPRLRPVRSARLIDDSTILIRMHLGEKIALYYVDENLSLARIKRTFDSNTYRDIHTLFVLAQDLLPLNGATAEPSEALRLLLAVYSNKVYAAKTSGAVAIFPVYFDENFRVSYGKAVDLNDLSGDYALVDSVHIQGVRHIADFERSYYHADNFSRVTAFSRHPLQQYYDVLGVEPDAPEDAVKRAYREKAHQNHPDRDPSPDATRRMQAINEAYEQIMKQWK